ncbi:MAG: carbohydrate porin [Candidatus Scalindua sp.]|nr:carbohydrate porin [Candidatus Scalindua sp.]
MEKLVLLFFALFIFSKRFLYYSIIIGFLVFFTNIPRYVSAGEERPTSDLLSKAHSTDRYKPGFFDHEHLFDYKLREDLAAKGLTYELVGTYDFVTNHDGGYADTRGSGKDTSISWLTNNDLMIELDTEAAGLWKNGTFFTYIFYHDGANPTEDYIGDLQMVDNFESEDGLKFYEYWYEHTFDIMGTKLSLLAGQHDLNGEFGVTEYGLLFVQSSFGFNAEISNNIAVANFPVAALGFRARWDVTDNFYFMSEISDGDPGPNDSGLHPSLSSEDGFVLFNELVYHYGDVVESSTLPGTYKLGWWYHSDEFDDVRATDADGNAIVHDGNYGIYFIADQMLLPGEGDTGLGAFLQIGGVPDDRNLVDFYVGGGIHYKGVIPSRDNDILGLAVAHAQISGDQRDADNVDGYVTNDHETVVELTYKTQVFPWLAVQPGVQYIANPGAVDDYDDAVVSILRFQVNY